MSEVNVHEAKTHFSKLLRRVSAGETIVICRSGKQIAKLIPMEQGSRHFGMGKGLFQVPEDLDSELPAELSVPSRPKSHLTQTRILLDTHVSLRLQSDTKHSSEPVLDRLRDRSNEILLSAASSWEMAIKYRLGKLPLPERPETYVPDRMRRNGIDGPLVSHAHSLRVAELPNHHKDPYDCLLIAQAQLEGLELMSVDPQLDRYDVRTCRPDE